MMQTWVAIEAVTDEGGRTVFVTEAYDPPVPGAQQVFAQWPDIDSSRYRGHKVRINWLVPDGFVPGWLSGEEAGDLHNAPVVESRSLLTGRRKARRMRT